MADEPVPVTPASGWKPTTSTVAGAMLGTAIAQILIGAINQFAHVTIGPEMGGAITTVCIFASGYMFPDGGRK